MYHRKGKSRGIVCEQHASSPEPPAVAYAYLATNGPVCSAVAVCESCLAELKPSKVPHTMLLHPHEIERSELETTRELDPSTLVAQMKLKGVG